MPFNLYRVFSDDRLIGYIRAPDGDWAFAAAGNKFRWPHNMRVELD